MDTIICKSCLLHRDVNDMASGSMCKKCYRKLLESERVHSFDLNYATCRFCDVERLQHQFPSKPEGLDVDISKPCIFCRKDMRAAEKKKVPRKRCIHCKVYKAAKIVTHNGVCDRCVNLPFRCGTCLNSFPGREFVDLETKMCIYCTLKRNHRTDIQVLRDLMRNDARIAKILTSWIQKQHDQLVVE